MSFEKHVRVFENSRTCFPKNTYMFFRALKMDFLAK